MSKKRANKSNKMLQAMLDIVIPIRARFDLLQTCIERIPEACEDVTYNLIIIDNDSPNKAEADIFFNQDFSKLGLNPTIIRNKENYGFPKSCNIGARRKQSPLIFFLNSDVFLEPGSVKKMVIEMDDPKVGVVGMKLVFPENSLDLNPNIRPAGKLQHIGLATNIRGDFIHIFVGWDADHPKVNAVREPYAVTGAALMVKRKLFNQVGNFFEGFGMGTHEDVDLCLAIRELGYTVRTVPDARGTHFVGATAEKLREPYPLDFNRLVFLQRWAGRINYSEYLHW